MYKYMYKGVYIMTMVGGREGHWGKQVKNEEWGEKNKKWRVRGKNEKGKKTEENYIKTGEKALKMHLLGFKFNSENVL